MLIFFSQSILAQFDDSNNSKVEPPILPGTCSKVIWGPDHAKLTGLNEGSISLVPVSGSFVATERVEILPAKIRYCVEAYQLIVQKYTKPKPIGTKEQTTPEEKTLDSQCIPQFTINPANTLASQGITVSYCNKLLEYPLVSAGTYQELLKRQKEELKLYYNTEIAKVRKEVKEELKSPEVAKRVLNIVEKSRK
jgi:hypothetical protein